jgi:F-type H+-transporting ATPase subunit delta
VSAPRVAARYAEALFGLALDRESVGDLRRELADLVGLLEGSDELRHLLGRADLPAQQKLSAVEGALGGAFSKVVFSLLAALVRHGRGEAVAGVVDAYDELADEAAGVVRAEVCTVVPLGGGQRDRLTAILEHMTGQRISLAERVDPTVLAGVRLQVGDRLIDGSAAGRLARLREELIEERG